MARYLVLQAVMTNAMRRVLYGALSLALAAVFFVITILATSPVRPAGSAPASTFELLTTAVVFSLLAMFAWASAIRIARDGHAELITAMVVATVFIGATFGWIATASLV